MPESIENILDICLEKMKQESATIDECIADFPEYQDQLREMLSLAIALKSFQQITASKQFSWQAANRLSDRLPDAHVTLWQRIRLIGRPIKTKSRRLKMQSLIVSIILALGLLFGGTFVVDASAPGDLFYDLDRSIEQIRLKLTSDTDKTLAQKMQNASERLEEAYKKLQKGDMENALKALENYNEALDEIKANEDGQIREETRAMTQEEGALQAGTLDRIRLSQPEDAQARSAFQKALQRANMGLEQHLGPPEEAPQGPSEEIPRGPASEDAQGPNEDAPQGPNEDAPQGVNEEAPHGPNEDAPKEPTNDGNDSGKN